MILVNPKFHRRKYCYGGSGIFDIFRKVISKSISSVGKQGLKKVINKVAQSKIVHKLIDTAVDGATSGVKKVVENAIVQGAKLKKPPLVFKNKKARIGLGIVLD